jgi:predicted enzyme related to lactoylglutathione lyase
MAEPDRYIPGVPCWADTSQPDPEAAVDFYSGLFGWECENVMPPDAPGKYFIGRIRGEDAGAVTGLAEGAPEAATWNTYIQVESADETALKAAKAGATIINEPFDVMEDGRMAVLADPEGAVFCIWEPKAFKGAAIVNEHGSVNFNDLHTRDPESAKRFYGEVFGWETLDVGASFTAWALPAYGDRLEELNPGHRELMKEGGAPEGFESVVASMLQIPDDQPDTPAYWGITFGIDDADAAAKKAVELGGEVLLPPMEAPWVRMTVLRDPQGATFTASQFKPENKDLGTEAGVGAAAS